METHFHTGGIVFLTVGIYATIWFAIWRLIAMFLATHDHDTAASVIGGMVSFPANITNAQAGA